MTFLGSAARPTGSDISLESLSLSPARAVQEIIASWLTQKNAFDLRSIFLSCCTDRYAIGQLMSFSTYFARLWNEKNGKLT